MNIYESIKNYLKEAYEVGINDKKIIDTSKQFSNMLENTVNKHITKDVIQAVYKLINSGQSLTFLKDFETDSDGMTKEPLETFRLPNGETLYLYGPIAINHDDNKVWATTVVSIGAPWSDVSGSPIPHSQDSYVWFTTNDGAMSLNYILDNIKEEDKKKVKENLLSMLDCKQEILQLYKHYCKTLASRVLSKSNEMGETRRKDIADKQKHVSNILDK